MRPAIGRETAEVAAPALSSSVGGAMVASFSAFRSAPIEKKSSMRRGFCVVVSAAPNADDAAAAVSEGDEMPSREALPAAAIVAAATIASLLSLSLCFSFLLLDLFAVSLSLSVFLPSHFLFFPSLSLCSPPAFLAWRCCAFLFLFLKTRDEGTETETDRKRRGEGSGNDTVC